MSPSCPHCGQPVPTGASARFCAACGRALQPSGETLTSPAPIAIAATPRRDAASSGRFLPGDMVGGRYRMVGLLGRGGMGEVYRADDLKLGQPVALKFLPADVERDPERLERFLTEVRLSLRVTHPNVCRVFDIGQIPAAPPEAPGRAPAPGGVADVRHFLSMEYVDGEDLASLLRRIGRLPEDKAIEISRQLCAGLSAAHEEGVLHRDLKPANIMIDGRGRAKITDFGLAGATGGISGNDARSGTPQYMAPEQVRGGTLSEQTDIYALGLVLYQLFTGKRAFEIRNLDDLERLTNSTPASPASLVAGLNPLVERAILRCLEADPARRPASANALAAALPGGDPLAMAIAAGDTPSPEMVAAAGSDAGLRPAVASVLLAVGLVGVVIIAVLAGRVSVNRLGAPTKPPAVMVDHAREILRSVGFSAAPVDWDWGLSEDNDYLNYADDHAVGPGDDLAARGERFWYREAPVLLERLFIVHPDLIPTTAWGDPPLYYSGEVRLALDRDGRLMSLESMSSQRPGVAVPASDTDWSPLFRAAGLDPAAWMPDAPQWSPWFFADRRVAWVPRAPMAAAPQRVEAGSFQGRPVGFQLIYPWTTPSRDLASRRTPGERAGNLVSVLILTSIIIMSALIARQNLRLDRADRRGAVRLAAFAAAALFIVWVIDEHHVPSIWELYLFVLAVGWALFVAALLGTFYLALEPYVRRTWPATIMSWSRVTAGTWRDPLVARDTLIGVAFGGATSVVNIAGCLVVNAVSGQLPRLVTSTRPYLGAVHALSEFAATLVISIFLALVFLFILFVMRRLLRREWAAIAGGALLLSFPAAFGAAGHLAGLPFIITIQVLTFVMLARVGLVATIVALFTNSLVYVFPLSLPPAGWTAGVGLIGVGAVTVLAVAAFRIATTVSHKGPIQSVSRV